MMTAWSELPNAAHIDRIIASVKAHPKIWGATWDATWGAAWNAAGDAAWNAAYAARNAAYAARNAAWDAARNAAWKAAGDAAWKAVGDAVVDAAWKAVGDAALALIAYDDCAHYLNMSPEQLKAWAILSEKPAAALLLYAVIAFEQIGELEAA